MSLPPPEVLQAAILNSLATNANGAIDDSRQITYNGGELRSGEQQGVVKSVLDSLWSKEVSRLSQHPRQDLFLRLSFRGMGEGGRLEDMGGRVRVEG